MLNPKKILKKKILIPSEFTKCQQNGIDCSVRDEIVLPPKKFVNVLLNEEVELPSWCAMTLQTRSSFSRNGIFITSGLYDSGFKGAIGCSIYNFSDQEVVIPAGERILQAIFWKAKSASLYNGKWQGLK